MNETPDKFPEAVLHAYADGVLEEERRSEVEAYLAAKPSEAKRVEAYMEQNEFLRRFAQAHADDPIPEPMTAQFRRHRFSQVARAAVVVGWILFGAAGGLVEQPTVFRQRKNRYVACGTGRHRAPRIDPGGETPGGSSGR